MKKYQPLTVLLLTLISLSSVFGQNSILWEVSGNGLTTTSYLHGSLKFIGEKEFIIHQEIEKRLKMAGLFAIEDQVNHHAQHELNKAIHFPKGESLETLYSTADFNKIQSFFQSQFGISKKKFSKTYAKIKPLALSIAMTRLSLHEEVKFYDMELLKMANNLKMKTYSLEAIDREAEAFNAFPIEDQATALLHSIDNFDKQKDEYLKLEAAYIQGDIDKVFEYSLHPFEKNATFMEEFYFKRNLEWLPKIESMIAENISFISVGVTHMEGEKGLLNLLKEKGYTLTPIQVTD